MKNKHSLGQFYTTNSDYIVGNLLHIFPATATVIDPFAGNCDLLNCLTKHQILAYDIEPQHDKTIEQNTLSQPPDYQNKWILTNPPYLAKNKNNLNTNNNKFKEINQILYTTYNTNDLYKIALKTIMKCEGGIIILPLNFWCEEISEIRQDFLSHFIVKQLNIFEEQVFDDTTYTVCAFSFIKSDTYVDRQAINTIFFPHKENVVFDIQANTNFKLGAEFYQKINITSNVQITRLCAGDISNSNIKLRAIDTGSSDGRIKLEYVDVPHFDLTPNKTERCFASLNFSVTLTQQEQLTLIKDFNEFLETNREQYHSIFLTNFRNSTKAYARKRISFETAYQIIKYILQTNLKIG